MVVRPKTMSGPLPQKALTVVGLSEDGCLGLSARAHHALSRAQILVGTERTLAFFPDFHGQVICPEQGLVKSLNDIIALSAEDHVVILASGDPLFFGLGRLLIKKAGPEHVGFIPQPSSMQWAFAKVGMAWEQAALLSVHGRPLDGLAARLRRVDLAGLFTDLDHNPARIAQHLLDWGMKDFRVAVCENLCGPDERVRWFSLDELAGATNFAPLNVLILVRQSSSSNAPRPLLDLVPEETYLKRMPKKGLITKKEVRVLALAALRLSEDAVVWDIGAGSGSVAIEAAQLAYRGRVYAIECDPEGVEIIQQNIRSAGTDHVRVVAGRAPQALEGLASPQAVFIGGSKGAMGEIIHKAADALTDQGRLVIACVTMENIHETYAALQSLGWPFEMVQIACHRGAALAGRYLRYDALNPIHLFYTTKPTENEAQRSQEGKI